jgi:hypothetical protein
MRNSYDDILFGDHIFDREVFCIVNNLSAALICKSVFDFRKIIGNDLQLKSLRGKNSFKLLDKLNYFGYSFSIFVRSKPVKRCKRISRIDFA